MSFVISSAKTSMENIYNPANSNSNGKHIGGGLGYKLLQMIGDEAKLNNFVADLSTLLLVGIIIVCIILLSKGADWMIEGVVHLAERTGLPKIVIGATIVSSGNHHSGSICLGNGRFYGQSRSGPWQRCRIDYR